VYVKFSKLVGAAGDINRRLRPGPPGGRDWLCCRRPYPRQFLRLGLNQGWQDHAVGYIARSGQDLHDQFGVPVLHHVTFVAVKPLPRGLAAETGVRVGRVAAHIVIVVIAVPVLLFQAKQVHLGGHVGGVDDVQPVRHQTLGSGLLHHLVEQALEALGSLSLPEAAKDGVTGWQFFRAQAQERLEKYIPGTLLLNVPVRELDEELQENHLEYEHRVQRVPAPIHRELFQGRFDQGEVHGQG
jgi:hypothetical protein